MFDRTDKEERETRKFWEGVEKELGLPVIEHALGQYLGGSQEHDGPVWGLIYLTERALYFRHFATTSWFSAILSSGKEDGGDEAFVLEFPLSSISAVVRPQRESFWQRIVRPAPRVVTVRYAQGSQERELRLSLEHKGEEVLSELERLLGQV